MLGGCCWLMGKGGLGSWLADLGKTTRMEGGLGLGRDLLKNEGGSHKSPNWW